MKYKTVNGDEWEKYLTSPSGRRYRDWKYLQGLSKRTDPQEPVEGKHDDVSKSTRRYALYTSRWMFHDAGVKSANANI